ncbi:MAG: GYD domain-containing protein [candidate division Zixibacteria bacterium]|nr:GYD domain-containing protein [candidate division Zixibacteria bacterium]
MASFIMAMNILANAKKLHSDLSHQIDLSLDLFSKEGISNPRVFATMGRYDIVALFDAEDQNLAFKVASQINALGILETETWPVIPFEDFSNLIGR